MDKLQRDAQRRLRELAPPTRKDERWRFADVERANLKGLTRSRPVTCEVKGLKPGASWLSLEQAMDRDAALVGRMLEHLRGSLGSEYFMSHAWQSDLLSAACLWVEKGVALKDPVILDRSCDLDGGTGSVLTLVVAESGASVPVLERFRGGENGQGNVLAAAGVAVSAGGQVHYVVSQELPKPVSMVQCLHLDLGRDSEGELGLFNQGASWVRQEATAWIREDGATGRLLGLNLIQGNDLIDQHTRQRHSQPHGTSDLLYKNALFDEGRVTFGGLIQVEEGAHYTDAYQSCRNLLLSERAEANAMPGLEINADQVKCSHGAATGQIDPEELFYLKARGIADEAARRLVTLGFANEVVDRLSHPEIREVLRQLVEETLRRRAATPR